MRRIGAGRRGVGLGLRRRVAAGLRRVRRRGPLLRAAAVLRARARHARRARRARARARDRHCACAHSRTTTPVLWKQTKKYYFKKTSLNYFILNSIISQRHC